MSTNKKILFLICVVIAIALLIFILVFTRQEQTSHLRQAVSVKENKPINPANKNEKKQKIEDQVKSRLSSIANEYQETLRYPLYSSLLTNEEVEEQAFSNSIPIERPYDIHGIKGQVALSVENYYYKKGDAIDGYVLIDAQDDFMDLIDNLSIQLVPIRQIPNKQKRQLQFDRYSNEPIEFNLPVTTDDIGEHTVMIEIGTIGGQSFYQSTAVVIDGEASAEISSIGEGQKVDNEIHFPYTIETKKEGYYRIRAQLFSQDGNAIASLHETFFTQDNTDKKFRLSGLLMRDLNVEPPFVIKNITIEHVPSDATQKLTRGTTTESEYVVNAPISRNDFNDAPTVHTKEVEDRIQFFNTLKNKGI